MSFNPNDNKPALISRNNYEEYFLLYADGELNQQDRMAVEAFVLANTDLQTELDLLFTAKMPPEDISLTNKESLLADSMKLNAIDESLLLYLDNELDKVQRKSVEEKLLSDKSFALQYQALLKTKLEPEQIVYSHKKELYHHEEKRRFVFSAYWMRVAVAVIILLGMGVFWFTYQPNTTSSVANFPANTEEQKNNPSSETSNEDVVTEPGKESVEPTIKIGETDDVPNITRHVEKKSIEKETARKGERPSIATEQNTITRITEKKKPEQEIVDAPKNSAIQDHTPAIVQQQTVNNKSVTPPPIASLNNQTTDALTAVHAAVVEPDDDKKSKLKGFLRKATRFIERRTHINTTNENNELLIGAVAIQL